MRPITRTLLAAAAVAAALSATPKSALADVAVSISVFHDDLAPHGRWVAAGSYGHCWVPAGVRAGWEPYVDGQWVWTDYGWTWISDDPWSDVVYHYGTWAFVDPYGWVWVPGTVWAPAWVTWAYTDDYVGWAPVPPSFVVSAGGYVGAPVVISAARYVFVPAPRFAGVNVATVRIASTQAAAIFPRATKVTRFEVQGGVVHTAGPSTASIERATGHPLPHGSIDRVKARPTSLAAAGAGNGRVAIVAPAQERARMIAAAPASREAPVSGTARVESRNASHPVDHGKVQGNATHVEQGKASRTVEQGNASRTVEQGKASRTVDQGKASQGVAHGNASHQVQQGKASRTVQPTPVSHVKGGPPPEHAAGREVQQTHAAAPAHEPVHAAPPPPEHAARANPPAPQAQGKPPAAPPAQAKAKEKAPPPAHGQDEKKDH